MPHLVNGTVNPKSLKHLNQDHNHSLVNIVVKDLVFVLKNQTLNHARFVATLIAVVTNHKDEWLK